MKNLSISLLSLVFLFASCSESLTLPEVSIISPSNNSTSIKVLEGVVKTSAIEGSITQLNLYFDGDLFLSLENPNQEETFSLLIDKTPNRYKLKAEAIDDNGNIGFDEIDIQVEEDLIGPEVDIISPSMGQNILNEQLVHFKINSKDVDGKVETLQISFNNNRIKTIDNPKEEETVSYTINEPTGNYKLFARAIDNDGIISNDEVTIYIFSKNDYLKGWTGIYNGPVDIWSNGLAGSASSLKDLRIEVTKSAIDSALNFSITIDNETEQRNNLRVDGEGYHRSDWGGGSNYGFLNFEFFKDSLSYSYLQTEGIGRTDGHDGNGIKQ